MPLTATKERPVVPVALDTEDPRELAGDLTRELADLTAEMTRLQRLSVLQGPRAAAKTQSRINALSRRIGRIHARIEHLANHC